MTRRPAGKLRCVELEPALWPAVERLFGEKGACGGCWCMWWRVPRGGKLWGETRGEPARKRFRGLVERGQALGVLAFEGDQPVGWCAFGPRADFPRLERVRAYRPPDEEIVWSINCFYIAPGHRGQGVARALLGAAVAGCRRRGARTVEGYPVAGKRLAAAFTWTGPLKIFEEQGFVPVQALAPSRPLVRRSLRKGR